MIPFNKPFLSGKEISNIRKAIKLGKISGNGLFTKKCQNFFENHYSIRKCLLTTSCTDALEMSALLCNIKIGDEVIVPSYTFVSSALAFVREGARIIFADSSKVNPNIDVNSLESLVTSKTKAIIVVHYAGISCDMDPIMKIAKKYNLFVVEDAAQSIDSYYQSPKTLKKLPLGSIGHFASFSFHETKNINCGEGGALAINDKKFIRRAEIIWEKGTNRAEFSRNKVKKYTWLDIGSSFLPSEITSAFLWAQLNNLKNIQNKRFALWNCYYSSLTYLSKEGFFALPKIPSYATNNAHIFYIVCRNYNERSKLILYLKENRILSVPHYLSLHLSNYYKKKHDGRLLLNSEMYTDCLLRLPMFYELSLSNVKNIVKKIKKFYALKP